MGRSRYKVLMNNQTYFATCAIINWISLFSKPEIAQIILDSLKFLQLENRLQLHAYVILENHLHLIASSSNLQKEIRNFKSFTARQIIEFLKEYKVKYVLDQLKFYKKQHKKDQEYQLWQEGYHPQSIVGEKMCKQKLEYIHYNPVKRGYVDDPAHWRYSSQQNYAGQEGLIEIAVIG